jgi:hypothetical protein
MYLLSFFCHVYNHYKTTDGTLDSVAYIEGVVRLIVMGLQDS